MRRLLSAAPRRARLAWPPGFDAGVVHRLDVSTSGALLVADDPEELWRLREAFATGGVLKTYRFVSNREVPWSHNVCGRPVAHAPRRRRDRMVVQRGAKTPHRGKWYPAQTEFERLSNNLWRATMRTGVMHQIRAHAAFVGISLAGDPKYGGGLGPADAPSGTVFLLHHVGLRGDGVATDAVPLPAWAQRV